MFFLPFCLGKCEWTDCTKQAEATKLHPTRQPHPSTNEPLPSDSCCSKHEPLPSSSSLHPTFQIASEGQLTEFSKGLIPANTTKSTKWALKVFDLWREAQNQSNQEDAIPNDILMTNDPALLNTHLSRFAVEARKVNGDNYPPSTIHHFCVGYCST